MKKIMILILMFTVNLFAQDFEYKNTDFKSLYNDYQSGQPDILPWAGDFFSYASNGTAVEIDKDGNKCGENCGRSPMQALGELAGHQKAQDWEKAHHSCEAQATEEEKNSCRGWWGHCNGWAGAAIKEPEPKLPLQIRGVTLSVGEQKGIFSELWLSCNNLFTGTTNKSKKTDVWVADTNSSDGRTFWDVTPRTFFMLMTNYIGVLKTGVVIDRFTGDQVWNQPVVGYRHMPISKKDIWTEGGKYFARITTQIFWANDLGTPPGHISSEFDIHNNDLLDRLDRDYDDRELTYVLQFDKPVVLDSNGKIESAGRLVGDGTWQHYLDFVENGSDNTSGLDQSHPDFIWLPTNARLDQSGYGNPYLDMKAIDEISKKLNASVVPTPGPTPTPVVTPDPTPVTPPIAAQDTYVLKFKIMNKKIKVPQGLSEEKRREFIKGKVKDFMMSNMAIGSRFNFALNESTEEFFTVTTTTKDAKTEKELKKIVSKLDGEILSETVPSN